MSFESAAREQLRDSQLRVNLRKATRGIRAKRADVVGEVEDWENFRDAGARIKDEALAALPERLVELEGAVAAAGGQVHWARTAAEANSIVVRIATEHGVDRVTKVKSIATDEIGLNEALEAAGTPVLETDLAEFIIQLAGDEPSHILVPAIHRNRREIRDIFAAKIGYEGDDDDPSVLAGYARAYLRNAFLNSRMAVSGANFAIAETGAICIVESEGNGRMCTTLPEVLVSVVGIEKVLSRWSDLATMLTLLPRSSTGERMNPYTSLWTGTRGGGPAEFHLVLLDNGRTATLADPVGRDALRCIRCSACLNVCPVYSRTGGHAYESVYPGPIGAILTPQLREMRGGTDLPGASSLCGACYEVCPVKIDIPSILVHLRGRVVAEGKAGRVEGAAMRAAAKVLSSRRRYEVAQRSARLAGTARADGASGRFLPPPFSAWTASRDLPPVPRQTFREWWRRNRPTSGGPVASATREKTSIRPSIGATPPPEDARAAILAATRAALATPVRPTAAAVAPRGGPPREDLDALFLGRVGDYAATARSTTVDELGLTLGQVCAAHGAKLIGLPSGWSPEVSITGVDTIVDRDLGVDALERLDGVVTGCGVAIAETGTLVLDGSAACGRPQLTLLPDLHICIVEERQIVADLREAISRLQAAAVDGRRITFISGPSATSDIELTRVEGVHGPRRLEVILVREGGIG
ncbi:MAG TPA: LUD domain-containing protein [Solirubrobacterales bacterium]|jgi:L-lactate dehydrogenase complex protein LldF